MECVKCPEVGLVGDGTHIGSNEVVKECVHWRDAEETIIAVEGFTSTHVRDGQEGNELYIYLGEDRNKFCGRHERCGREDNRSIWGRK